MSGRIFKWLFAATMGFFLLCCSIFGVAAFRYAADESIRQLFEEVNFVAACTEAVGGDVLEQLPISVRGRISWIAADGRVLYDSYAENTTLSNQSDKEEVQEALSTGKGESRRYSDTQGAFMQYVAVRLKDGSVMRLANKPYSVLALLGELFYPILVALVLSVVLSILLAFGVSRRLIQPINDMDLTSPDERDVYPELRPLVRRINTQNRQIRHQMEELKVEHEKQDAMRREFTANVTHELKTPLTSISGFAELMRDGLVKPQDVSRFGGKIYDESQRLITLVGDIIKLSRMDSHIGLPEKTRVDLYQVCVAALSHLEHAAKKKQVAVHLQGTAVSVFGAESVLYEMVYNLCDNAIKYNHPTGEVTVNLASTPDEVCLTVSDTGIGIPEGEQERVFERFYRVDKSHSKEVGGTGLGLSIVKHSAAFHGATIAMKSTLGQGTTIAVRFPASRV